MRRLIAVAVVVATTALLGVSAAGGATKVVRVDDNFFSRGTVTVNKNDYVKWRWVGQDTHNVKGPGFRSAYKVTGTYRRQFKRLGTFNVICELHPNTMKMRVKVVRP